MTDFKNKNIDKLLSKLFSPDQTEQMKNDFTSADALFEEFPAPVPADQMLADIKQKINRRLERQNRTNWSMILLKTAAVAAIIIIAAVIWSNLNGSPSNQSARNTQYAQLWEKADISISSFEAEISQLKTELAAIDLGEENNGNGLLAEQVEQAEIETIEMENIFWKG